MFFLFTERMIKMMEFFYRFVCFEFGVLVGLLITAWNDANKK